MVSPLDGVNCGLLRTSRWDDRQLMELRAAQTWNAGLLESDGSVLLGADDV